MEGSENSVVWGLGMGLGGGRGSSVQGRRKESNDHRLLLQPPPLFLLFFVSIEKLTAGGLLRMPLHKNQEQKQKKKQKQKQKEKEKQKQKQQKLKFFVFFRLEKESEHPSFLFQKILHEHSLLSSRQLIGLYRGLSTPPHVSLSPLSGHKRKERENLPTWTPKNGYRLCSIVATYSTPFLSTAVFRTSNSSFSWGYFVSAAKKCAGGMPNSWFSIVMFREGSESLAASRGRSSNRRAQTREVFPASVKARGAGMDFWCGFGGGDFDFFEENVAHVSE